MAGTGPRDRSLMWIASAEGEGDVAVLLTRDDKESMGCIGNIGVRKSARGRGLAGFLLRHAFGTYAARGRDTIGLAVDTPEREPGSASARGTRDDAPLRIDTWEPVVPVSATSARVS